MSRLSLILTLIATLCALSLVTAQHKARKLFIDLQQETALAKQLEVEWGQLQLEQSTLDMHARIEKIATERLQLRVPDPAKVQIVPPQTRAEPVPIASGTPGKP